MFRFARQIRSFRCKPPFVGIDMPLQIEQILSHAATADDDRPRLAAIEDSRELESFHHSTGWGDRLRRWGVANLRRLNFPISPGMCRAFDMRIEGS
jgi:hypothetical protein